jgi:glycine oxidase
MRSLKGLRVVVAGAGAVGSVLALRLARSGAVVVLADRAGRGANASGVAAGMLAPVFESLLDPVSRDHFLLLREARDLWPSLLRNLPGAPLLDRSGALLRKSPGEPIDGMADRLSGLGAEVHSLSTARVREIVPMLADAGPSLFTPGDWRLEPRAVLEGLQAAFVAAGGEYRAASVIGFEDGQVRLNPGKAWAADALILATGFRTDGWPRAAGEHQLTPIKGHILRFAGTGPYHGPVVRGEGGYIVPDAGGVMVGATMEPGHSDLDVDRKSVERLRAAASSLMPCLDEATAMPSVGVRAATADGLPLVGQGRLPGVLVARGARRNGWLLAPLMAQVILDRLMERPASAAAKLFDPERFT